MTTPSSEPTPDDGLEPAGAGDAAAAGDPAAARPIVEIKARERLQKKSAGKVRLRDDLVHGEKRMEAAPDDIEPAPLEPLVESTPATAGTWSHTGAAVRRTPMDAAYHAKVRRNQIAIEQAADAFRITIWLVIFGLIFPAGTVFTATGLMGWARVIGLPILTGSCVALYGLYHRRHWSRPFALHWPLALLGWYLLQPVLLCTGILVDHLSGADVFYLAFVYVALAAGTVLTPIWRIRRSEWELGLIDSGQQAENQAAPLTAEDEIETEAGWDEADPPPPA